MLTTVGEVIYLAGPYTDKDPKVSEQRFRALNKAAASLMHKGFHVYCAISHTHPITLEGDLPTDWEFWKQYDTVMLSRCNKIVVVMLEGWDKSTGVAAEIEIAKELGLPVEYMEPV